MNGTELPATAASASASVSVSVSPSGFCTGAKERSDTPPEKDKKKQ
jgi:hypothetical protein